MTELGIPSAGGRTVNVLDSDSLGAAAVGGSSRSSIFDTSFLKNNPAVVVRRKRPLTVITPRQQQQQQQQQKQRRRSVAVPQRQQQQQQQPIFSSVPAVPRQTILAPVVEGGGSTRARQSFEAPSTPRFTVVRRRRPPGPSAAVLERRRQQIILSSGARSVSGARQRPRLNSLPDGAVQSSGQKSSNPSIFETPDGRFFLISNARQEFRDGQFFQTPDGRLFRISAMEGKEAEAAGAALRNEAPEPAAPAAPAAPAEREEEEDDRLALILDKIRSRAKAEKAREKKAEAVARVRQEAAGAAERRRPQLTPAITKASTAPAREGRPRSPSHLPRRSNNVASDFSSSSSSSSTSGPQQVTGSPSIFRTSDGKLFVISSSGNEFDDDQYFQTPDGRLFKISAMDDKDIAQGTAVDIDNAVPPAEEPGELALDIGDADPFAVADALRKNNEEAALPGYNAAAPPLTSVTSSVSVVMGTATGADKEAAGDNSVGVDESEDDDAVIVAERDHSNRGATSESATDIPVFIQRQPLFSSNQIFGRGSLPRDDQPAQNHLLIRTANGNGLIIPQQFVLQTVSQSELRGLLGLPEQQQLQQRGVLLFDGSGNAFNLEI